MPTVQQTSNKISRRLSQLERRLKQQLQAFYTKHIKGSNAPIQVIRQRYGEDVEQIIRNSVQTSWFFANDIIEDRTGKEVNLSVKDIEGIEKVSRDMTNQFWTTADKNLQREHEFVVEDNHLEPAPEFALPAAMLSISGLMIYLAFNSNILESGLKFRYTVRNDCIDRALCLPLNGKIYELGDPLTPQPPLHRHCHCHLIPIVS